MISNPQVYSSKYASISPFSSSPTTSPLPIGGSYTSNNSLQYSNASSQSSFSGINPLMASREKYPLFERECNASTKPVEMELSLGYDLVEFPRIERMGVLCATSEGDIADLSSLCCCFVDEFFPAAVADPLVDASVVDDGILSANTDPQYELIPVNCSTESRTTKPELTSGRYFIPMLSIIGRRYADVTSGLPPVLNVVELYRRDSDADGRRDASRAK